MGSSRILIVEDEQIIAAALRARLKGLGYECAGVCASGEEAIEQVAGLSPDLVLMDITLEGEMDGIEAAGQIYSRFHIPVIYLTAHADELTPGRASKSEPFGYIVKPWSDKELRPAIEMALYKAKMERLLRESEERYREFAELLPQFIFETDVSGMFSFLNRAGLQLLGYTRDDVGGGIDALEVLGPKDREGASHNFQRVLSGESLMGSQGTMMRADGGVFSVVVYSSPILKEGGIVGVRGLCVDISELKSAQEALQRANDGLEERVAARTAELAASNARLLDEIAERKRAEEALRVSEQSLRAIFETATDCIFIKDRLLRYTLVNPYLESLLELPGSMILGKTDRELFGKEVGDQLIVVESRVLRGEFIEQEHTRPIKGIPTTFLDRRAPMMDNQGVIIGVCGISHNITHRKPLLLPSETVGDEYPSTAMRSCLAAARLAGKSDAIVLLTGESGSGKDHFAKYIHDRSRRASGPFYAINCAAISPELAESEFFGHEAGAFTGAHRRKRGLLELAEGGTLLLNEIGELALGLQSKLLTFLETRQFTRVGGEKSISVDARLMAATNRDLETEVQQGRFRADLYYRLNVFSLRVPPLKERTEDLPLLVRSIIAQLSVELRLPPPPEIHPLTIRRLCDYGWPGNIRELRNVLERAMILARGGPLDFSGFVSHDTSVAREEPARPLPASGSFEEAVTHTKRRLIEDALLRTGGKRQEAADLLGMSRHALKRQMKTLGFRLGPTEDGSEVSGTVSK